MQTLRDFVATFTEVELQEIMQDYERFEKDGFIGDCTLRRKTEQFMETIGVPKHNVVQWMELMIKEVYRVYAYRYISLVDFVKIHDKISKGNL